MKDISKPDPSSLLREATQLSGVDMDAAIACLKCFKEVADTEVYDIKSYLRLPLYLQQAGRFDEAKEEFQFLLDTSKEVTDKNFSHQPEAVRLMLTHARLYTIYDKMRLAYQREGLKEVANEYQRLHEMHKSSHQKAMKEDMERTKKERENSKPKTHTETRSVKLPDPLPATKEVRVKGGAASNGETVAGCIVLIIIIAAITWAVVHFVF